MKEVLRKKKEEIRRENEKLNSSLTTALCKSEEAVLTNKKWMEEIKVHVTCMTYSVDWTHSLLFAKRAFIAMLQILMSLS